MTNVAYEIEDYRDIELLNLYRERREKDFSKEEVMCSIHAKGRDNARTPMQWDDSVNAGFSEGTPWIRVNPNYVKIHAKAALENLNSIFYYYKKLIALRKEYSIFAAGSYEPLLLEEFCAAGKVLIHNYGGMPDGVLRPYEAMMVYLEKK